MGVFSLFGEYSFGLRRVTLTLCGELNENCSLNVSVPNTLTFTENNCSTGVRLEDLTIKPDSLQASQNSYDGAESFSLMASCTFKTSEDPHCKKISERIVLSEELRCKFCDGTIVTSKDITKVENLPSVDLLPQLEANTFFCHAKTHSHSTGTPLSRMVADLHCSIALCNGVELIVHPSMVKPDSTKVITQLEGVFCSRCRQMLGRIVGYGSDCVVIFWTINLNVWTPEVDIDGEYLRHIEYPIIQPDSEFFEVLFSRILEDKHYRIILSAGTYDQSINYALIWLFDQRLRLYNATIDTSKAVVSAAAENGEESHSPKSDSAIETTAAECTSIMRVFYHLIPASKKAESGDEKVSANGASDPLLDEWSRDFSVVHLRLPLVACVSLNVCLSQINQRLPPHLRRATGHLDGFLIGGIPTRMW